jgi:hypothetical protein
MQIVIRGLDDTWEYPKRDFNTLGKQPHMQSGQIKNMIFYFHVQTVGT